MGYLYEACDEISDFCHQYLLRKCNEKWAYIFNVYKNEQSLQTGSRYLTDPKNASHNMAYLYEACDQISDSCHQ
jgi:hypothetical protein